MIILRPRSLQQRTFVFILIPTFLLLVLLSIGGFLLVRDLLLDQWGKVAVGQLELTAHQVDMRLRKAKDMLRLLQGDGENEVDRQVITYIVKRIEELEGVVGVKIEWPGLETIPFDAARQVMMPGMMHHFRLEQFDITSPRYNRQLNNRTVSLVSQFKNATNTAVGHVEVLIAFDELIAQIINAPWWRNYRAYLVDDEGNVLASTGLEVGLEDYYPMRAFGTMTALEGETLTALQKNDSGTVFGPGLPPDEISGYYHLREAPWTMVVIAPGATVLKPIIKFRAIYFSSIAACILLILLFIRGATGRVTSRIREISTAADNLASGRFGLPLPVTAHDEVGELTTSFNKMSRHLRQRLALKEAINVAREVQQNLLPHGSYSCKDLEISGQSIYCDETGGDYFDILEYSDNGNKVGVVVGDVVGHGIGAALLMTTVRALLRCRIISPGRPDEIISDVNRLLCLDTRVSGSFVTLFYVEIDRQKRIMSWVRGGHDPVIVYRQKSGIFSELKGKGMALGVDADYRFEYNERPVSGDELLLIGSDGAWEVENSRGEQFGKERLKRILAAGSNNHPDDILTELTSAIEGFRGETPQNDDITLAVIKIR